MKRIPAETDLMMWTLVESGDQVAIDAFAERYPELRGELARRATMVRGLRSSRPARIERPPQFTPPLAGRVRSGPWRPLSAAMGAAALLMVGFASFAVVSSLTRPEASSMSRPRPADESAETLTKTGTRVMERSAPAATMGVPVESGPATEGPSDSPPTPGPAAMVSIVFEGEPIAAALGRLANEARLRLEIAPGFPATKVSGRFEASGGVEILQELAARYRFSVFDQGDGRYLVIPAVDPSQATDGRDAAALEPADRP
jgi:hypothetical protein